MNNSDFIRVAISSANKYLAFLKEKEKGKSVIRIRKIQKLETRKYQLFLHQKALYVDAIQVKVSPSLCPSPIHSSQYKILSYNEKQLVIEIAVDAELDTIFSNASPSQITLESDMTFLVKSVLNWYYKYGDHIRFPHYPGLNIETISYPSSGSKEQNAAIASGLSKPITYVWGAPGTGKTRLVLSGMIYPYISDNLHVLVMAPTNNSLEQSLRGIIEVLQEKGLSLKKIIRLGRPTSEFLHEYPEVCEANRMNDLMKDLEEELLKLKEAKKIQDNYRKVISEKEHFEQLCLTYTALQEKLVALQDELDARHESFISAKQAFHLQKRKCSMASNELEQLRQVLARQNRYKLLSEQFQLYNQTVSSYLDEIQKYTEQEDALRGRLDAVHSTAVSMQDALWAAKKEQQLISQQMDGLWNQTKLLFARKKHKFLVLKADELASKTAAIQKELLQKQSFAQELEERCQQIGSQVTRLRTSMSNDQALFKISRSVFQQLISVDMLGKKFQEELDTYNNFEVNESLEELVEQKAAQLTAIQTECDSSNSALQSCAEAHHAVIEKLNHTQKEKAAAESEICLISSNIFGGDLSCQETEKAFLDFLEQHSLFTVDPELETKIQQVTEKYDSILNDIHAMMMDRSVIACTVDYATLHYDQFPSGCAAHLFVDEAAYCPLIKAGVFFSLGIPVTLLGDHMQLPPVCEMNRKSIIQDVSNQDCFLWDMSAVHFPSLLLDHFGIEDLFSYYVQNQAPRFENVTVSFLTKTYRFGEELAAVLDQFIYQQGFHGTSTNHTQITVIDAPRRNRGLSFTESPDEASAIETYISENSLTDFSVLAPYKLQRNLLENTLKLPAGKIMTIHASQGREWDTVILSVTDAHRKFFMSSTQPGSPGKWVVNTAVSRAKKHLVLVLDYQAWEHAKGELISGIAAIHDEFLIASSSGPDSSSIHS